MKANKIVKLSEPITIFSTELGSNIEVSELELKPPTARQMRSIPVFLSDLNEYTACLIEHSAGISKTEVDKLSGGDFLELQKEVLGFLERTTQ